MHCEEDVECRIVNRVCLFVSFVLWVCVCVCVLKEMLSQCAEETGHAWRPGGKQEQVFSGQTRLAIKEHTFDEHLEQGMAKIEEKMSDQNVCDFADVDEQIGAGI